MTVRGYTITARMVAIGVAALFVLGLLIYGPAACMKLRAIGAQNRMDQEQGNAFKNSAADAIETVSNRSAEEIATEELTRTNEREIRDAQGASERVGAGVNAAGLRALCRREAYRDSERCKLFKPPAR